MKSWLVPAGFPDPGMRKDPAAPDGIELPDVTPRLAGEVARSLKAMRPSLLRLSNEAILRAIDETIADWLAPGNEARVAAESAFRAATGLGTATAPFSPALEACEGGRFREWARIETEPTESLEGFIGGPDGVPVRASGPDLAVHVLPGNVPLVWLPGFLACLLMRTPCLLKSSLADPLTPALFCGTLARKLPALVPAFAVLPWRGGDAEVETAALAEASALIAYGDDESIRALATRLPPGAKLVAHGSRFAAGLIARDAVQPGRLEPLAGAAARDVLLYDGRGCLSLCVLFVERGGLYTPREVANLFAREFPQVSRRLPPGRLDRDAAALTQSWRARERARALSGKPAALLAGEQGLDWTVIYDEELTPPPEILCRTLWVLPVDSPEEIRSRLGGFTGRLHALAFAGPDQKRAQAAEDLVPLGLTRVCSFGDLQNPPLSWPHGGGSLFKRLINWTRMER